MIDFLDNLIKQKVIKRYNWLIFYNQYGLVKINVEYNKFLEIMKEYKSDYWEYKYSLQQDNIVLVEAIWHNKGIKC